MPANQLTSIQLISDQNQNESKPSKMENDSELQFFVFDVATGTPHSCRARRDASVLALKESLLRIVGRPEATQTKLVLHGYCIPEEAPNLEEAGIYPLCTVSLVCGPLIGGSYCCRRRVQDANAHQPNPPVNQSSIDGLSEEWAQTDKADDNQFSLSSDSEPEKTLFERSSEMLLSELEQSRKKSSKENREADRLLADFKKTQLDDFNESYTLTADKQQALLKIFKYAIEDCKKGEPDFFKQLRPGQHDYKSVMYASSHEELQPLMPQNQEFMPKDEEQLCVDQRDRKLQKLPGKQDSTDCRFADDCSDEKCLATESTSEMWSILDSDKKICAKCMEVLKFKQWLISQRSDLNQGLSMAEIREGSFERVAARLDTLLFLHLILVLTPAVLEGILQVTWLQEKHKMLLEQARLAKRTNYFQMLHAAALVKHKDYEALEQQMQNYFRSANSEQRLFILGFNDSWRFKANLISSLDATEKLELHRKDCKANVLAFCDQEQLDGVVGLMTKEEESAYYASLLSLSEEEFANVNEKENKSFKVIETPKDNSVECHSQILRPGTLNEFIRLEYHPPCSSDTTCLQITAWDMVELVEKESREGWFVVFMTYSESSRTLVKQNEIRIDEPIPFKDETPDQYKTYFYTGDQKEVFWFSLSKNESDGEDNIKMYTLAAGSFACDEPREIRSPFFKQLLTYGNIVSNGMMLSPAVPRLYEDMLVYSHHRDWQRPCVYFYDLQAERDIVKVEGASTFIHGFAPENSEKTRSFIFKLYPRLCEVNKQEQIIEESYERRAPTKKQGKQSKKRRKALIKV